MAIDTQKKRASVLWVVQPDGAIDQADRQTVLKIYGGILAGLLAAVSVNARAKLQLSRKQLAAMCGNDPEAIRIMERLFAIVNQLK